MSREGEALNPADYEMVGVLGTVTFAANTADGGLVKYGTGTTNTSVVGTSADFPAVREFRTIVGRFFDADEVQGAQRVAVVGQTVLTNLGVGRSLVGDTLRINNVPFEVIGILEPKGVNYAGIDEDDQILIPISTALRRLFNLTFLSSLYIQAKDERAMGTAARQITNLVRERWNVGFGSCPSKSATKKRLLTP